MNWLSLCHHPDYCLCSSFLPLLLKVVYPCSLTLGSQSCYSSWEKTAHTSVQDNACHIFYLPPLLLQVGSSKLQYFTRPLIHSHHKVIFLATARRILSHPPLQPRLTFVLFLYEFATAVVKNTLTSYFLRNFDQTSFHFQNPLHLIPIGLMFLADFWIKLLLILLFPWDLSSCC